MHIGSRSRCRALQRTTLRATVLDWVLAHVHAHYAEPIRVAMLAERAAMSESQLQRFFKRCTRMTVSDYLAQLRIGRACALLLESEQPISRMAEAAGYGQPSYFTRQFREVKGGELPPD